MNDIVMLFFFYLHFIIVNCQVSNFLLLPFQKKKKPPLKLQNLILRRLQIELENLQKHKYQYITVIYIALKNLEHI